MVLFCKRLQTKKCILHKEIHAFSRLSFRKMQLNTSLRYLGDVHVTKHRLENIRCKVQQNLATVLFVVCYYLLESTKTLNIYLINIDPATVVTPGSHLLSGHNQMTFFM